jgi:hypothetical protein
MSKWTIVLDTDPESGDLIMPIPDELMDKMNWQIGDTVIWKDNQDGSWSLSKKEADAKDNHD